VIVFATEDGRVILVELSIMEQRYHAVMEVISDAPVTEVAGRYGVTRQAVHNWLAKHRTEAMMSSRPCADGSDLRAGAAAQTFLIAANEDVSGRRCGAYLFARAATRAIRCAPSCWAYEDQALAHAPDLYSGVGCMLNPAVRPGRVICVRPRAWPHP
jgi:transposase-like protein